MNKTDIQAIVTGRLADVAATFMFNQIVGLMFGKEWSPTPFFLISGLSFVVFGGYIAGKLSKTNKNKLCNAALVGILGMIMNIDGWQELPLWYGQIGFFSMPITAFLGGLLSTKI